jgi:pimeloyl-ACP methyl ester carboxylesterase
VNRRCRVGDDGGDVSVGPSCKAGLVAVAEVGGLRVHFEMTGSGPEHVIFVHGLRNSADTWWPVRDHIDPLRYTATYLDLPGCGESDTPPSWERCTIDAYAELVKAFCEIVGVSNPAFVGHSLGGGIGLALALAAPGFFRGLVLVAPVSTQGLDFVSEAQFDALLNPSDKEIVDFAMAAFHRPVPEDAFEHLLATVRAARPAHVEGALRSFRDFKILPRLRDLTTPTLVIGGDRDRHVPVRFTLQTAAAIPRCAVQIYHGVGHVPFWEVQDDFVALLERYLSVDLPAIEASRRARRA